MINLDFDTMREDNVRNITKAFGQHGRNFDAYEAGCYLDPGMQKSEIIEFLNGLVDEGVLEYVGNSYPEDDGFRTYAVAAEYHTGGVHPVRLTTCHEIKFRYWNAEKRCITHDSDCKFSLLSVCTCGLLHQASKVSGMGVLYPQIYGDLIEQQKAEEILLTDYPDLKFRMEKLEK